MPRTETVTLPRLLLVAEALGFKGGGETGIPLSSPALLRSCKHPFIETLRPHLALVPEGGSEATATGPIHLLEGHVSWRPAIFQVVAAIF